MLEAGVRKELPAFKFDPVISASLEITHRLNLAQGRVAFAFRIDRELLIELYGLTEMLANKAAKHELFALSAQTWKDYEDDYKKYYETISAGSGLHFNSHVATKQHVVLVQANQQHMKDEEIIRMLCDLYSTMYGIEDPQLFQPAAKSRLVAYRQSDWTPASLMLIQSYFDLSKALH